MVKFMDFYAIRYLKILFILWIKFFYFLNSNLKNNIMIFGKKSLFKSFNKYFYTYSLLSIISLSHDKFKFLSFNWNLQLFYYIKIKPVLFRKRIKSPFIRFRRRKRCKFRRKIKSLVKYYGENVLWSVKNYFHFYRQ